MNIIVTENLQRAYRLDGRQVWALRGVSCGVRIGTRTVITGPSGSGKSTLLALMAALDRPTAGRVLVNGEEISGASEPRQAWYRKELIGIVFQEQHLLDQLTALENVILPLTVSNLNLKQRQARGLSLLDEVGLIGRADHRPRQLSGGERQRVALARALVRHPKVILADEPTAGLDLKAAEQVAALFENLRRRGRTLIIASHDPLLSQRADQLLTLVEGELR